MKTLKLLLIVAGIFLISSAYSFTLLNLLIDDVAVRHSENPIVLSQKSFISPSHFPIIIKEREKDETKGVELEEIVVSAVQLNSSSRCIRQQLGYPSWAVHDKLEGTVMVGIAFNSNGFIEIRGVNSSNKELGQYVVEKLRQVHFNNCMVEIGKEYHLKFDFQLL